MAQAYPQTILQNTLQTLSKSDAQPSSGADLIKDWQSALKNTDGAEEVHQQLTDLYDELLNPTPDNHRVKHLLNTLAGQTQLLARNADTETGDNLTKLADSLRSFSTDLNRIGDDSQLAENQTEDGTIYDLYNPGDRAQKMFIDTLETLAGGAVASTPEQGATMVEDWITVVRSDVSTQWIEAPLGQLRDALNTGDLRSAERLLRELAGTVQEYANNNPDGPFSKDLTNLATALISFSGPLS
ncbi:hypothetical protein [Fibrella forsythiae]|uniref:Uncharacterized protein n=1 Tax=Fibrella forsythiae TaxID=2817061 RepID=A0ABS3JHE8_9BACT|nr:hypothetical protein [Fibrella forsythiae]MBO0948674.1 hypothetical protein [Fibrella forsythiae]